MRASCLRANSSHGPCFAPCERSSICVMFTAPPVNLVWPGVSAHVSPRAREGVKILVAMKTSTPAAATGEESSGRKVTKKVPTGERKVPPQTIDFRRYRPDRVQGRLESPRSQRQPKPTSSELFQLTISVPDVHPLKYIELRAPSRQHLSYDYSVRVRLLYPPLRQPTFKLQ